MGAIAEASRQLQIPDMKLHRQLLEYGQVLIWVANQAPLVRKGSRLLTFNGETMTLLDWVKRARLLRHLPWKCLQAGWSMARVLTPSMRLPAMP